MIAIVDYKMGNIVSVQRALNRINVDSIHTNDHETIRNADKIILPGVGHFGKGVAQLKSDGLFNLVKGVALEQGTPVLGICLGMQLLCGYSEESGDTGLELIPGATRKFPREIITDGYKIPHIGWNTTNPVKSVHEYNHLLVNHSFYFVHSYYVTCDDNNHRIATTQYGIEFDSVIQNKNIIGTQFHPEKSHSQGIRILEYFCKNQINV